MWHGTDRYRRQRGFESQELEIKRKEYRMVFSYYYVRFYLGPELKALCRFKAQVENLRQRGGSNLFIINSNLI